MNKLTASYIAGFLDGEGCFSIWYRFTPFRKRGLSQGRLFYGCIRVGGTNKEVLEWLQKSFGGTLSTMNHTNSKPEWKQAYQWALNSKPAIKQFLRGVTPYLRVKKRQAEILDEFLDTFNKESYITGGKGNRGRKMKPEVFEQRRKLREKMCLLNQKGKPAKLLYASDSMRQSERLTEGTPKGEM